MAAKKYLSLEETADSLGISSKDLITLRERGEIRGFADRGTWKFKAEDVEEYQRRRQADSNPDVPMLSDMGEDVGDQPTIIRRSVLDEEDSPRGTSDSDVRLIIDPETSSSGRGPAAADSDSDVRLMDDSQIRKNRKSTSDVRLSDSESDVRLSGLSSIKKKGSDSDVALVGPGSKVGQGSKVGPGSKIGPGSKVIKGGAPESDSDVRLSGGAAAPVPDRPDDSDIRLSGVTMRKAGSSSSGSRPAPNDQDRPDDSDVRLSGVTNRKKGSDSDVKLVAPGTEINSGSKIQSGSKKPAVKPESDSDVKLVEKNRGGGTMRMVPPVAAKPASESVFGDDDLILDDDSGMTLKAGSGISLEKLIDSGVSLEAGDSGIALLGQADDDDLVTGGGSGILISGGSDVSRDAGSQTLEEVPESGLELSDLDDSGISLDLGADSGIGLIGPGDSGIQLESPIDSGISLEGDDLNRTIPMMATSGRSDMDATNLEVPSLDDEGSNYELRMPGSDSEEDVADTSVIMFDDESDVEDHASTRIRKSKDMDDSGESFDLEDAGSEEVESLDDADDLDVADDVVGEDDELDDMDVFDAADEDFDESFETGESHAEFVAPARGAAVAAPVEQEWGAPTFVGLLFSTGLMALCGMVMFDLVRSMWGWQEPNAGTGAVLQMVSSMFGGN